jgi:hypothetical protein
MRTLKSSSTAFLGIGLVLGVPLGLASRWIEPRPESALPDLPLRLIEPASNRTAGDGSTAGAQPAGLWRERPRSAVRPTTEQRQEMERLAALGYVAGTQESAGPAGIVTFDRSAAFSGVNLYCSGHAPEAILMNMEGRVLHRWSFEYGKAFPDAERDPAEFRTDFWRKVHLYPNGDLLAIFEGLGMLKLDKDSNLLWASHNASHHDMAVRPDGKIYVLTRVPRMIPEVDPDRPVLEDFVTVLGPDGVERRRHSLLEAVRNSDFSSLMDYSAGHGDVFHTNTLEILDGRFAHLSPVFREGNALVSLCNLNAVAIVDLEINRVVWVMSAMFKSQHDPGFTDDGHLLIFDNSGHRGKSGTFSKVVEVDPLTQQVVWAYLGDEENGFFTQCCGTNQRLPNGNTLITASEPGRAFEVTPDGRIVWEFSSPHRAGDHGKFVATLMEVRRLEPEFPLEWLTR